MRKSKVLYILNNAPDYRDSFLTELGKHVDLTVAAYPGAEANLRDPEIRNNYKFIPLKRSRIAGVNLNFREFTLANGAYDCVIVGFVLNSPLRLLNLFRKKKVLTAGLIYGRSNGHAVSWLRRFFLERASAVLVYTDLVKKRLDSEISNTVIAFNNTSFKRDEITPVPLPKLIDKLNVIWVGRYQERKKIERLYQLVERDSRVNVRVIGPGMREAFAKYPPLPGFDIRGSTHGDELLEHFEWCHTVFNPGGAGLLVMNAARMGRSIVIDQHSSHGPEIQLALDAKQDFIDFADVENVKLYIDSLFQKPEKLEEKADLLAENMMNYTIEFMVQRYLEAINNE